MSNVMTLIMKGTISPLRCREGLSLLSRIGDLTLLLLIKLVVKKL